MLRKKLVLDQRQGKHVFSTLGLFLLLPQHKPGTDSSLPQLKKKEWTFFVTPGRAEPGRGREVRRRQAPVSRYLPRHRGYNRSPSESFNRVEMSFKDSSISQSPSGLRKSQKPGTQGPSLCWCVCCSSLPCCAPLAFSTRSLSHDRRRSFKRPPRIQLDLFGPVPPQPVSQPSSTNMVASNRSLEVRTVRSVIVTDPLRNVSKQIIITSFIVLPNCTFLFYCYNNNSKYPPGAYCVPATGISIGIC